MKPKLNSKVWIISDDDIYEEKVAYLGRESFLIEYYAIKIKKEFRYESYGFTWVKTLKEAKAILQKKLGPDAKIVKVEDDWWRVKEEEK